MWQPKGGPDTEGTPVLAVLADGMGGHVGGEKASHIATTSYVENFASGYARLGHGQETMGELLEHSLIASNGDIGSEIRKNPTLNGMGCTIVAAYLDTHGLRWSSVGNFSLLLYRHNLRRLNEDHSIGALLDRQAEAKLISFEEAKNDPRRRTLRSALTGGPIPVQETVAEPEQLIHGDWVIVASDGLETLSGNEIARIVARHRELGHPRDVVRELIAEIKRKAHPNQDNVSIIVIKVEDPHDAKTRIVAPDTTPVESEQEPVADGESGLSRIAGKAPPPSRKRKFPNLAILGALVAFGAIVFFWPSSVPDTQTPVFSNQNTTMENTTRPPQQETQPNVPKHVRAISVRLRPIQEAAMASIRKKWTVSKRHGDLR